MPSMFAQYKRAFFAAMWLALLWEILWWTWPAIHLRLVTPCYSRCWNEAQAVTRCRSRDTACLCDDLQFQDVVFYCLADNCPPWRFATALHRQIDRCPGATPRKPRLVVRDPDDEHLVRRSNTTIATAELLARLKKGQEELNWLADWYDDVARKSGSSLSLVEG